jgi:adenylate cyclase
MTPLRLSVLEHGQSIFGISLTGPIEAGRQRDGEPAPYHLLPGAGGVPQRLVLAPAQEKENVSRQHLLLEPLPSGQVRVKNLSQIALQVAGRPSIPASSSVELPPPFSLRLPPRTLLVAREEAIPAGEADVEGLSEMTVGPGSIAALPQQFRSPPALDPQKMSELVGWLQTAMGVLQASVGATDFLNQAASALVKIVGLNSSRVLLIQNGNWCVAAVQPPQAASPHWRPSSSVLGRVFREKRTCWQQGQQGGADSASLVALSTVVAAPLLDREGKVIGALYGESRKEAGSVSPSGGKLEAMLVELLACGIASGLARQEQEKKAVKSSALFEQFFTPELARHLALTPDLLDGREAQVSVLFCDVRGFSSASERLGPQKTFAWINDVMQDLSLCIREQEGVLVDYIGDELLAMWGAPELQQDQAERAVRAGLAMLAALEPLNARWEQQLGQPIRVGVGVNSGPAHVGNTGSKLKFKYGPLGNTVNLGSRVQGMTKYLRCPFLVTASTRKALGAGFIARRVVKTRVVNIETPVDLYEVEKIGTEQQERFFQRSEAALDALETGDFASATRMASELLPQHRRDGPLLLILSRASAALVSEENDFDPVWKPPGK